MLFMKEDLLKCIEEDYPNEINAHSEKRNKK